MNDTLTPYIVEREKTSDPNRKSTGEPPAPNDLIPEIIEALKTVYDPEIPVNIYDLVLELSQVIRIRTGETGEEAIQSVLIN